MDSRGRSFHIFHEVFKYLGNVFKYLENKPPTENAIIISCIIQEPCSDRLILKEGLETSPACLITDKSPHALFPIEGSRLEEVNTCLVDGMAL